MRTNALLVALAVIAVAAIVWATVELSARLGNDIGTFGLFAYLLGGLFTLLIGGGLFFLLFFSARKGYDDIDRPEDDSSA